MVSLGMGPRPAREAASTAFEDVAAEAEPRLRRALVARYGVELGNDLCSDALAYGWEHRDRVGAMTNPIGYLYRVAQSSARRYHR
jgi:DNA-directed RNA polymerase specialized sigma24 family protein